MTDRSSTRRAFWLVLGVALATTSALGASGCRERVSLAEHPTQEDAAQSNRPSTVRSVALTAEQVRHGGVRWSAAERISIADSQEMPGELVPNEDQTVRLSAPARARVVAVHAEVGDHVTPGQVLVRLQGLEAATARAEYAKALADLQGHEAAALVATAARERAERLLVVKAGSRQDAERARADDELAQAGRRQAQAEVERGRAALDQLGVDPQTGEMHLRSALAGVVLLREAVPGAVVDAGTPLVVVADLGTLWLTVNASEAVASALRPGSRLRFAVPAYPSDTFETRVTAVAGAVDATTRTVAVRALVSNASRRLRPAMFATVWADTGTNKEEIVVPDRALQLLDERPVLFIASPDGDGGARFERRDVEVGSRAGGRVHISSGLEPDALVVTDGAFAVKSEFARAKIRSES